ncbi:helix-turn-helix transcriptional regulator [Frigidibacter sp. ROC022]|uniref:helix-turn-helix transcriptional regulator n=1 Tax=Frigidibacter sp. ROC022 TaxID=2971796 RepID=UPI00215A73A9|nr:WYL domain-containing protein [Frigidibacter sp. ROC022]MCR8726682.1 WYL domain-containing protein [Frigidibacter sp. ROC022]
MRWGVEKRLEFIEFRLFWEGGINRADIIDQFGVSVPQASKDLTLYEEKAPGNLRYDKSAKRYRASDAFKPVFLEPDASAYLAHLRTSATTLDGPEESWLAAAPEFDAMPVPHRSIDVSVLRELLTAIRESKSLEIRYQSMNPNRSAPEWRRISPHALGNDGLRWHVRAFCHVDSKFKDFILSRCLKTRNPNIAGASAADDILWNEHFTVELSPNPALSENQQAVIAHDYAMSGDSAKVPIRKALLYYFQKRLRLDVADKLDNPHEIPVVVANRVEFDAALDEAMA